MKACYTGNKMDFGFSRHVTRDFNAKSRKLSRKRALNAHVRREGSLVRAL
jgi:hypothetical protein